MERAGEELRRIRWEGTRAMINWPTLVVVAFALAVPLAVLLGGVR